VTMGLFDKKNCTKKSSGLLVLKLVESDDVI
jgi:hypothetical protein